MKASQRALFANLIDYAGLFPPAALPMDEAVRNYDAYRRGEHAWMLGRFVVSAAQMHDVTLRGERFAACGERVGDATAGRNDAGFSPNRSPRTAHRAFPLSVLGPADNDVIEVKAATPEDVKRIAELVHAAGVGGATTVPPTVYVEISDLELVDSLGAHGLRAKIRTGGVTPEAFPAAEHVAAFIRRCAEHGVPFKATAGLHHPLRCIKPLTYAPDAPTGTMHGFVNVFLASALLPHVEGILAEDDPGAFAFTDETVAWRGHAVRTEDLLRIRREFAISFGSCSFEEPVADLKELGWL